MIKVDVEIKFDPKQLKELLAKVNVAKQSALQAGIFEDPALAFIAACHEYGVPTKGLPMRSFARSTMHANSTKYSKLLGVVLTSWQRGEITIEQALEKLGYTITQDMQETITRGVPPDLKPATVKGKQRRGSPRPNTPLRDTDRLFNGIKAKIAKKGG